MKKITFLLICSLFLFSCEYFTKKTEKIFENRKIDIKEKTLDDCIKEFRGDYNFIFSEKNKEENLLNDEKIDKKELEKDFLNKKVEEIQKDYFYFKKNYQKFQIKI